MFLYYFPHTLVFLDYYLTIPRQTLYRLCYSPYSPYDIPEEAVDDVMPDRVYSKDEMLDYPEACRKKCHTLISGLTEEGNETTLDRGT
ncbi:MAG: hypothetical protein IPL53_25070 [Ignavibacteria bacterium]|nr:hypothetical protein [Ignavibacteria bacterium]